MAYDKGLAQKSRKLLAEQPRYAEKKMSGGICFLVQWNMVRDIINDDLIVRVGLPDYEAALALPQTHTFDVTGRTVLGWIMINGEGYEADEGLCRWIRKGAAFALTLPSK